GVRNIVRKCCRGEYLRQQRVRIERDRRHDALELDRGIDRRSAHRRVRRRRLWWRQRRAWWRRRLRLSERLGYERASDENDRQRSSLHVHSRSFERGQAIRV